MCRRIPSTWRPWLRELTLSRMFLSVRRLFACFRFWFRFGCIEGISEIRAMRQYSYTAAAHRRLIRNDGCVIPARHQSPSIEKLLADIIFGDAKETMQSQAAGEPNTNLRMANAPGTTQFASQAL